MKEINECNLIYDLLPTYVDNLASEDTKEFIKNHIKTCNSCKQKLEDMCSGSLRNQKDEELTKEQKDKDKLFIDALNKIKRRNRLMIIISIISVSIFFSLGIYFFSRFKVQEVNSDKMYTYGINNIAHSIYNM